MGSLFNKGLYATNLISYQWYLFLGGFGVTYLFAFMYGQTGYLKGRMSIVSTLVNIISVVIPFIGGIVIFGDALLITSPDIPFDFFRYFKILGFLWIILGVILCYHPTEKILETKSQ